MNSARLLIVEDEYIVASDIRKTLTGYGYDVVGHETSGEEALIRASEVHPDLALVDIVLRGELNGIETARELERRFGIPVIFLTSYADEETLEKAKLSSPYGFLIKPYKDRELRATIETALQRIGLEKDLRAREQDLRESEDLYHVALENANDAFMAAQESRVSLINPRFLEMFGYPAREEVEGKPVEEFFHPDERERVIRSLSATGSHAFRGLQQDGTTIDLEVSSSVTTFKGHPMTLTYLRDISQRKKEERKVQEDRDRLQAVLDSIEAVVYVADMQTYEILLINEYARQLFGDIEGRTCWKTLQASQTGPCTFCTNARLVDDAGMPTQGLVWEVENSLNRRWYECRDRAIRWLDGRVVRLEIATDITDRKLLEHETQRARNLESLGFLAGGIAHDFNNLLTTVLGNIELVKIYAGHEDRIRSWIDEAVGAAEGACQLTTQLLTFSRGGVPILESLSVRDLIAQTCSFALSGATIKYEVDFPEDTCSVKGDREQLSQVFHNLLMNAREAMPAGGRITVHGENLDLPETNDLGLAAGRYVRIEISDTGRGIAAEILPKVFDPYFSTKPLSNSKGTGLGLAICYSIVRKHGGSITLASTPGRGTRVAVLLPVGSEELSGHTIPTDAKAPSRRVKPRGRVLFMEDEEPIIRVTGEIFRHLGLAFEVARKGEDAVALYARAKEEGRPFDCVILDLTVRGGMGGLDTLGRLKKLDPGVRAVVSSGYADDRVIRHYADFGFCDALIKPYRVRNVKDVLDRILPGPEQSPTS